jgi:hypothetical protein
LQINNLEKLIFVSKNYPNDFKIGCAFSSKLVELIEMDIDAEENFEKCL